MDGWDFKQYVLGILFCYISKTSAYINEDEHAAGMLDFDYARLSDAAAESAREDLVNTRLFILPSELFEKAEGGKGRNSMKRSRSLHGYRSLRSGHPRGG